MHLRSSALVSGKSALDMYVQFSSVWHVLLIYFDRRKMDGTITTFFSFCVMVELMEVSSSYRFAIHQSLSVCQRAGHMSISDTR